MDVKNVWMRLRYIALNVKINGGILNRKHVKEIVLMDNLKTILLRFVQTATIVARYVKIGEGQTVFHALKVTTSFRIYAMIYALLDTITYSKTHLSTQFAKFVKLPASNA